MTKEEFVAALSAHLGPPTKEREFGVGTRVEWFGPIAGHVRLELWNAERWTLHTAWTSIHGSRTESALQRILEILDVL